jgi:hypothetical protein
MESINNKNENEIKIKELELITKQTTQTSFKLNQKSGTQAKAWDLYTFRVFPN